MILCKINLSFLKGHSRSGGRVRHLENGIRLKLGFKQNPSQVCKVVFLWIKLAIIPLMKFFQIKWRRKRRRRRKKIVLRSSFMGSILRMISQQLEIHQRSSR